MGPSDPPRASGKQRLVAAAFIAIYLLAGWLGWRQAQADFMVSKVVGYGFVLIAVRLTLRFLPVVLTGRMSRSARFALDPTSYGRTVGEIHGDAVRRIEDERKRSRRM
ncbi:MAG TPA: hypothetical protein VK753_04510 [Xanthomonadaceae bacterium]|jgi:hypothetical protein|nr:hypothetical protein [Xanthomonadaceae bacterium]